MGIDIFRRLAPEPVSVTEARAALSPLADAVDPSTFETLRLLVSEVVSNSVRHGGENTEGIELAVRATREAIRVEVSDGGIGFDPTPREEDADQASGWGLHLLDSFSDRWGTERNGGMRVWFELVDSGAFAHRARLDPPPGTVEFPTEH